MSRPDPKTLFEKLMAENELMINIDPKIVSVDCADGSVIIRPTVNVNVVYTTPEPPEAPAPIPNAPTTDPHEQRSNTILDITDELKEAE